MDKFYSTAEVAKAVGVHKKTLLRWIWAGEVSEPQRMAETIRLWTEAELNIVRAYKEANYRKRS